MINTKRKLRALLVASLATLSLSVMVTPAVAKTGPPTLQDSKTGLTSLLPHKVGLKTSVYTQWGEKALAGFQYGLTTAYGSESPIQTVQENFLELPEPVNATIEGLTPSTTYHYQAGVLNSFGSDLGADRTFTTPPMPKFKAKKYPAYPYVSGTTLNIDFEGSQLYCSKGTISNGEGVLNSSSSTLKLPVAYSECTAFGFYNGKVEMNGCAYVIHPGEVAVKGAGELDIVCPEGKVIEVEGGTCKTSIPAQSGRPVTIGNTGSEPQGVSLLAYGMPLEYTKVKDGFLCPLLGTGPKQDGLMYTNPTIGAFDSETHIQSFSIG